MEEQAASALGFPLVEVPATATESVESVLRFLVDWLLAANRLPDSHREEAVQALLRREQIASTAIGRGMAVPHARMQTPSFACLVGRLESNDGRPGAEGSAPAGGGAGAQRSSARLIILTNSPSGRTPTDRSAGWSLPPLNSS